METEDKARLIQMEFLLHLNVARLISRIDTTPSYEVLRGSIVETEDKARLRNRKLSGFFFCPKRGDVSYIINS